MNSSDPDATHELLKSISISLKGIHNSLEHLTAAVEGVAESIERAHEPEGDLGVHLVSSLKDLTSVLHKRAQSERSVQPQQGQRQQQQQGRRDDRHQRPHRQDNRPQERKEDYHEDDRQSVAEFDSRDEPAPSYLEAPRDSDMTIQNHDEHHDEQSDQSPSQAVSATEPSAPQVQRPRPNRRRRGKSGGASPAPQPAAG